MRGYLPFGEKEEGSRKKRGFDEAQEETGQERAGEVVRNASQAAPYIQILADTGGNASGSPDYTPNDHARR